MSGRARAAQCARARAVRRGLSCDQLIEAADPADLEANRPFVELADWLRDRKNRRNVMGQAGYGMVSNPADKRHGRTRRWAGSR
jgi:hypothetical protein